MKILILSDSHGSVENMALAVERTKPQLILHLGDCWRDAEELRMQFPQIPMHQVPGNCDFRPDEPAEKLLFLEDQRVLMCHGHTYGVKSSLISAGYAAEEQKLNVFLFGHTHQPLVDWRRNTLFVNPGSCGRGMKPTYAVLQLNGSDAAAQIELL